MLFRQFGGEEGQIEAGIEPGWGRKRASIDILTRKGRSNEVQPPNFKKKKNFFKKRKTGNNK